MKLGTKLHWLVQILLLQLVIPPLFSNQPISFLNVESTEAAIQSCS